MTDYAVVLATHLAAAEGPHAARDLAVQTQIPEPTASKVLKKLARAGVVVSQRGAKGGYALARSPEQIGVNEVIEAIEGPIAVTECSDDTTDSLLRVRDQLRGPGQLAAHQRRGSQGAFRNHAGGHGVPWHGGARIDRALEQRGRANARGPARRATTSTELE